MTDSRLQASAISSLSKSRKSVTNTTPAADVSPVNRVDTV